MHIFISSPALLEPECKTARKIRRANGFCRNWETFSELKIDVGPGYRVYYTERGAEVIILLAGGDKSTQRRDIKTEIDLARDL